MLFASCGSGRPPWLRSMRCSAEMMFEERQEWRQTCLCTGLHTAEAEVGGLWRPAERCLQLRTSLLRRLLWLLLAPSQQQYASCTEHVANSCFYPPRGGRREINENKLLEH